MTRENNQFKRKEPLSYISLFSSAGVGCHGFKLEGFECIATNELIGRRLDVQRFNEKCKYDSGYICGDITQDDVKGRLLAEIDRWKQTENLKRVDVVIATPPCQGMSVANHKKSDTEIMRNSLVVESIKIIKEVRPRIFIFENVPAFMETICTDIDGKDKTIGKAIDKNLGIDYSYVAQVINFKDYGGCSSRKRTIVIGVSYDLADEVSPYELFPAFKKEKTLREVIGWLPSLTEMGEITENDIYHSFRSYPEEMRSWISGLKEGESAFDNLDDSNKPHHMVNDRIVLNVNKNSDKYKRQCWDRVAPCVHTRNDQLASQNTIHPTDDRVFSIRELMCMMTVPYDFKWSAIPFDELNALPMEEKRRFLKKEEIKIRQSLGEAVPTSIFQQIAHNIKDSLTRLSLDRVHIEKIIDDYDLSSVASLVAYVEENPLELSLSTLSRIIELSNTKRTENAAYYTDKSLITEMMKNLPDTKSNPVRILEPAVGAGNFIPLIVQKFKEKKIELDLVDVDADAIEILRVLLNKYSISDNVSIRFINDDFLLHEFQCPPCYDYVIGNPPFYKMSSSDSNLRRYRKGDIINSVSTNTCSFFLDKALRIGKYVSFVLPKAVLSTPEFSMTRDYVSHKAVECIIDFGEKGFCGVLIETIAIFINNEGKPGRTKVVSFTQHDNIIQNQSYIFDRNLPYWIIYRDECFDAVMGKLEFDVFSVFRDRQITKNSLCANEGNIRVLKSRNISDDGTAVIDIDGYDSYVDNDDAKKYNVYSFLDADNVYLTPNMTYYPRVMQKPKHTLVNGSVAILIPKDDNIVVTDRQLSYFSSDEFRKFYQTARNRQTRSLNVDACSVYFFGLLKP